MEVGKFYSWILRRTVPSTWRRTHNTGGNIFRESENHSPDSAKKSFNREIKAVKFQHAACSAHFVFCADLRNTNEHSC